MILALTGCAGSGSFGGKLFGAGEAQRPLIEAAATTARPGLAPGAPSMQAGQTAAAVTPDYFLVHGKCPDVVVEPEDQALTVYQSGTADGAGNVRYQATIDDTARECNNTQNGMLTLRVGVAGRVVSGPKPVAGSVNVPLRIAVYDDADVLIKTAYQVVAVPLTAPDYAADYSKVQEVIVPAPDQSRTLRIQAALDPNAPKPAPAQRAPAPRPANTAPRSTTAAVTPPAGNGGAARTASGGAAAVNSSARAPAVFRWPD